MFANKRFFRAFFLLSLMVGLICALGSCKKAPPEEQMVQKIGPDSLKLSEDAVKNLTLAKVLKGDFPEKLSLMGKISVPEDRTVVVPSRLTGRIEQIFVASGEVVRAGQPLCTIFSADFAVAREEYVQTLQQLKTNSADEEAKHLLELSKKKLNALGVSEQDYAKWGTPEETGHENLVVRAPRSGALLGKNAVIGNLVNVGDTLFIL
jgi:multidrug efflux pump subunit AcrA (membrane-fusion protein)